MTDLTLSAGLQVTDTYDQGVLRTLASFATNVSITKRTLIARIPNNRIDQLLLELVLAGHIRQFRWMNIAKEGV